MPSTNTLPPLPSLMRAIVIETQDSDDPNSNARETATLCLSEISVPDISDDEVLIHVRAAGVNRPDILQRDGLYPAPKGHSPILGLEVAGEIVAVGSAVSRHKIGDVVVALTNGGGYAEYCAVHEDVVLPVPKGLSVIEAAGLPETVFTVWHNVFQRCRLQRGEWLLVHGGSSGIGTTAIQMAKAMGSHVMVTAGSTTKCKACLDLGADVAVNYKTEDFVAIAKAQTGGKGVDVILDMVGGDYIERNFAAAAVEGRIVQIAFLGGAKANVNFMRLMLKRLTLTGSTLRSRDSAAKAAIASEVFQTIWPLIEEGKIKPVIHSVFPLAQVNEALKLMKSSEHIGKIILDLS